MLPTVNGQETTGDPVLSGDPSGVHPGEPGPGSSHADRAPPSRLDSLDGAWDGSLLLHDCRRTHRRGLVEELLVLGDGAPGQRVAPHRRRDVSMDRRAASAVCLAKNAQALPRRDDRLLA